MKISVIIPAYNAEKTIEKCLKALVDQTTSPFEILVVDDGSKDKTAVISKKWAKVIKNSRKKGPGGARNAGALIAKGEILAFTDSDCIPPKNWLGKISRCFSDKKVGAIGGGYSSGIDNSFWQDFCTEELKFRRKDWHGQVSTLVSNNLACRKKIFWEEGGFPENYPVCEDMLLSYKISLKHKVLWLENNGVIHHFKNSFKDFLKHQYFFGKESTRFFCGNAKVLKHGNHQGRSLHLAIVLSFFSVVSLFFFFAFLIFGFQPLARIFLISFFVFVFVHFLLYYNFVSYLRKKRFKGLAKAYFVSLARDLYCGFSVYEGLIAYLNEKK